MCEVFKKYRNILNHYAILRFLIENFDKKSFEEMKDYLTLLGVSEDDVQAIIDCLRINQGNTSSALDDLFN